MVVETAAVTNDAEDVPPTADGEDVVPDEMLDDVTVVGGVSVTGTEVVVTGWGMGTVSCRAGVWSISNCPRRTASFTGLVIYEGIFNGENGKVNPLPNFIRLLHFSLEIVFFYQ